MKNLISLAAIAAISILSTSIAMAQPVSPPKAQVVPVLMPTLTAPSLTGGLVLVPKKAMPILLPTPMAPATPMAVVAPPPVVDAKKVPRW